MWKCLVLVLALASCAQGLELELTSSLVTDNMWDGLIEKVERYILPLMPFWYEELEPHISQPTLTAHHMGYLNIIKSFMNHHLLKWKKKEPENKLAFESILHIMMHLDEVPEEFMMDLNFFGGGFVNHCFYFGIMSPNDGGVARLPQGYLLDEINENFESFDGLKKEVEESMKSLRGSGYIWVVRLPGKEGLGSLKVITTENQDSPVVGGMHPIITIDMWEHAYYLKHNYKKWEHLDDFWMVINWKYVERLDQWWKNLEAEQVKADERVEQLKQNIADRMAAEEAKENEEAKSEL